MLLIAVLICVRFAAMCCDVLSCAVLRFCCGVLGCVMMCWAALYVVFGASHDSMLCCAALCAVLSAATLKQALSCWPAVI